MAKKDPRQRLFIYDRKEIAVLFLLGIMVAAFAFTLGVHLGKRVGPKGMSPAGSDMPPVATLSDQLPNRVEIAEQGKGADKALDKVLDQRLKDRVDQMELHLETPKPVELPENTHSKSSGATTVLPIAKKAAEKEPPADAPAAPAAASKTTARFALQIGSYPAETDAKTRLKELEEKGLKPFLREADVKGKGKWFRVYVGEFATKPSAEAAGEKYRSQNMIESFIVSKITGKDG
jgi:cell division septation protein DedD